MKFTRRQFVAGLGATGTAICADAFGIEAHRVVLTRHDVPVRSLTSGLDGLRLAQVTDVHFPGNQIAARAALEHLHREKPDIVLLTGDMTESGRALNQVREFAAEARGRLGTVALMGNWEYRAGVAGSPIEEMYRSIGVTLLVNQSTTIDVSGVPLTIVGLDDAVLGHPDLWTARKQVVPNSSEIWLVHSPVFVSKPPVGVSARPMMLMAGHTHGGQIRIPFLPPYTPVGAGRFVEGWYYDTFAPLYVSRGIGTTTLPARFRCPAELPIFTLRAAP
jgi:predicted MPP superfamily phosphohydrolase